MKRTGESQEEITTSPLPIASGEISPFYSLPGDIRLGITRHTKNQKYQDYKGEYANQEFFLENLNLLFGTKTFYLYLLRVDGEPICVISEEVKPQNIFSRSDDKNLLSIWSDPKAMKRNGLKIEIDTDFTEFASPDGLQSLTLLHCTTPDYRNATLINRFDGSKPKGEQSQKVGLILTTHEGDTLFFIQPSAQIPNAEQP